MSNNNSHVGAYIKAWSHYGYEMENNLRKIRLEKGLTLEQVAERANTSPQQVLRLERNERRLTTQWLERLAKALQCDVFEILGASPIPIPTIDPPSLKIINIMIEELGEKRPSGADIGKLVRRAVDSGLTDENDLRGAVRLILKEMGYR